MILYPAIDIMGGKCVRLEQGDFSRATEFAGDPAMRAREWERAGASFMHVVDLDGARSGGARNEEALSAVLGAVSIPVQTGGGIRTMTDVERRLAAGAARVILGTAAVRNPELVREAAREFGEKIAVGVDARGGRAAVEGWTETGEADAAELCRRMRDAGVRTIIYTDIARDGMMSGPNVTSAAEIMKIGGLDVIVSGGVSNIGDLFAARDAGAAGAIIGRALYSGAIDLAEAVRIFEGRGGEC